MARTMAPLRAAIPPIAWPREISTDPSAAPPIPPTSTKPAPTRARSRRSAGLRITGTGSSVR